MYNSRPLTSGIFFLRILGGVVGGVSGTLVMLMIYFISLAALPNTDTQMTGITKFALITMILISTLTTNLISSQIISISDREKYKNPSKTMINIFTLNLILFILITPLYLFSSTENIQIIAAFHLLISAQMSTLMMEIFAGNQFPLIGAYSISFGGMLSFAIIAFIISSAQSSTSLNTLILFIAMPLVWGMLQLFNGLIESIYGKFFETYAHKSNPEK